MAKRTGKTGRPTKLSKATTDSVVNAIKAGAYIETAAAFVGISKVTLYAWMKQGRADEEAGLTTPHTRFLNAVEQALASAEMRDIMTVGKAAASDWKAAAWRLERRNWERWGRKDTSKLQHGGDPDNDTPIVYDVSLNFAAPPMPAERDEPEEGEDA